MNMLMTEWNMDDALEVRFEEGREEEKIETARKALNKGLDYQIIQELTGLDIKTIQNLSTEHN